MFSATQPEIAVDEQVEFYFSDSNAPRDMFLMGKIEAHPEVLSKTLTNRSRPLFISLSSHRTLGTMLYAF